MPLIVEEFLAADPELLSLRRSLTYAAPESRERQRLLRLITERTAQAHERWASGLEGWMTAEEAAVIAAELTAVADRQQRVARAAIDGDALVFTGARTEQRLMLSATSPVRARSHWPGYLEACPSTAVPADEPPSEPQPMKQLDLGILGAPVERSPRERSRMLSIPIPDRDRRDG